MTAAYLLAINMFIAAVFATAFGVVAATIKTSRGAQWVASGYALGIVYAAMQFIFPPFGDVLALSVVTFMTYLIALTLCVVGVALHYRLTPPWRAIAAITGASALAAPSLVMAYDQSLWGVAAYQSAYAVMQMLCFWIILKSGQRHPLDILLMAMQVITAATYILRPIMGVFVGGPGNAETYIGTTYAAVSQMLGAVTLIALALVLLLVIIRDTTAEMQARSETDILSGVLNRRGFESHAELALARSIHTGQALSVIVTDLDHFKKVNDNFGHAAGDRVIAAFADALRESTPEPAIIGRLGGEEFAIILPGLPLAAARRHAEQARIAFLGHGHQGVSEPVSASFGVAQLEPGQNLSDTIRQADMALYAAKANGRNLVCTAPETSGMRAPITSAA